jgi:hypothetical protein
LVTPDSGVVEIVSLEEDLPLVSELIATNLLHDRGREVRLVTKTFTTQLVGPEPSSVWVHVPRRTVFTDSSIYRAQCKEADTLATLRVIPKKCTPRDQRREIR